MDTFRPAPFIPERRLVPYPSRNIDNSSPDTLFTAGAKNYPEIQSILVGNKTGSAVTVSLRYNDGSNDFYPWGDDKSVPANDYIIIEASDGTMVSLKDGYTIQAQAGTGSALDIIVNVVETEGRSST